MEMTGVTLNTQELDAYAGMLRKQIISLESEIKALAGEDFNLSSPKQLGPILFEKLKIDSKANRITSYNVCYTKLLRTLRIS